MDPGNGPLTHAPLSAMAPLPCDCATETVKEPRHTGLPTLLEGEGPKGSPPGDAPRVSDLPAMAPLPRIPGRPAR
jgi:hypothetical protein